MTNPNLLAYHVRGGRRIGTYRIVMVQPFLPASALVWPERQLRDCDICGRPARWHDDWSSYCQAHAPKRVGEGA